MEMQITPKELFAKIGRLQVENELLLRRVEELQKEIQDWGAVTDDAHKSLQANQEEIELKSTYIDSVERQLKKAEIEPEAVNVVRENAGMELLPELEPISQPLSQVVPPANGPVVARPDPNVEWTYTASNTGRPTSVTPEPYDGPVCVNLDATNGEESS